MNKALNSKFRSPSPLKADKVKFDGTRNTKINDRVPNTVQSHKNTMAPITGYVNYIDGVPIEEYSTLKNKKS